MFWIIVAAALLFGAGLTGRIWKRGPKFWATWWRITSLYPMFGGLALLTVLPDDDWHGLLWLGIPVIGGFCLATYFMRKRAKKSNDMMEESEDFTELSKEDFKKLDKDQHKDYKQRRRQFRKEVRAASKWTKAQIIILWAAALAATLIYVDRLWFKLTVDGIYSPTAWWQLLAVIGVICLGIVLRVIPLKMKQLWKLLISYSFVAVAMTILCITLWLAAAHFVAVADKVQWVPGEGGADSDVVATTAIDNCPQEFRLDDDNDGEIDPIPDDPDYPNSQRVADDPGYLIRKAEEAGIWEEGRYSVEIITTGPDETDSNVNWCVSNFDAWIAMAKLHPERWENTVTDLLNELVDAGTLSPAGRDSLLDQLN
jgi:hypothetical protein